MDELANGAVTIFDVAREAGVSTGTVSRVLNDRHHVKPETREAVLRAMDRLGFVANQQARSLAGAPSRVIGLLLHTLSVSYMGEIVRGIDAELEIANYDLLLYTTHRRKLKEAAYVGAITRGMADRPAADSAAQPLRVPAPAAGALFPLSAHRPSGERRLSALRRGHQLAGRV